MTAMENEFAKAIQHLSTVIGLSHIPKDLWTPEDSLAFVEAQRFVRQHRGNKADNDQSSEDQESGNH